MTETKDIALPASVGGLDNLVFGFAEYAALEAERTFKTYTENKKFSNIITYTEASPNIYKTIRCNRGMFLYQAISWI